jgi:hypothetical protein
MTASKTCALLLPKKMVHLEICDVLSVKDEFQQTNNQKPKEQVPRILDPQFVFSMSKNKNGDPSDGTP